MNGRNKREETVLTRLRFDHTELHKTLFFFLVKVNQMNVWNVKSQEMQKLYCCVVEVWRRED